MGNLPRTSLASSGEVWADYIRFRAVQRDGDGDQYVDDWWKRTDNPLHSDGALAIPVFATYG